VVRTFLKSNGSIRNSELLENSKCSNDEPFLNQNELLYQRVGNVDIKLFSNVNVIFINTKFKGLKIKNVLTVSLQLKNQKEFSCFQI